MTLKSISDAEAALSKYIPLARSLRGHYDLSRMRTFLASLGNPQDSVKVVHIAGTSGKTSTAYFIRALLVAAGQKTGLTVSPYIDSITERLQLGSQPVSDRLFARELGEFLSIVEASNIPLTYFEVLMAFAYWFFARQRLDYAIIETGIGGLLDPSNVVTRPDKVSIISDIGYDHTTVLGKDIRDIARQKAGIMLPGSAAFVIDQAPIVLEAVHMEATKLGAHLTIVPPATHHTNLPTFQRRNWELAEAVYTYLRQRDLLPTLTSAQLLQAQAAQPPGRMEHIRVGDKTLILDGAHNPQKLEALRHALAAQGITRTAVLANFVKAPEYKLQAYFKELRPLTTQMIIPEFAPAQDLIRHSMPPAHVAERAAKAKIESVVTAQTAEEGLDLLLQRPESVVVVTGSLFLVSVMRKLLRKAGYVDYGTPKSLV